MRFMNEYAIERAEQIYAGHPVLGPAVQTLVNLQDWTNYNSDGWAYWPQPARAAAKLMALIEGDGTWQARESADERATPAAYRRALSPIKAFRTRQRADFTVVEL